LGIVVTTPVSAHCDTMDRPGCQGSPGSIGNGKCKPSLNLGSGEGRSPD